jgi:peptide/nickel transport system substrate-binding protein
LTNNTASGRHDGPANAGPHPLSRRGFLATGGFTMAALAASPLLAACSSSSGGSPSSGPSNALTVGAFQEPDTLDPGATGLALSLFIASQIYDPLMWWLPTSNGGYEFVPGLAQSYEVSSDGTAFTFHLRKGVTFHDGTTFDATAVKATFDHIVDPATKSRSAIGSLGPYKETKVLDQYTAQVVFKAPNAAFAHEMGTLLFGMTSPAALKKYGPTGIGNNPVGTGPFRFVSYTPQNQVALERNPGYEWGPSTFGATGPAKLKTLTFKILADTNARYNALLAGQIQMAMNLDPNDIASVEKNSGFKHLNVPSTGQPYGYPINVSKAPTDELEVRQAILHAVNQDQLIKTILDGAYQPAHNLLTPTTPGYSPSASGLYPYNPSKAKSLLESAGWKAGSGGVRQKNGKQLHLDILIQSANGFDLPTQFIANELGNVGFSTAISSQPFLTAAASYNKGAQNLAAIFYYDVDPYFLLSLTGCNAIQSGFNWAHYCQPASDTALQQGNTVVDQAKRNQQLQSITTNLMEQAIFLPLYNVSGVYSVAKNLTGLHFGPTGYALFHTARLV